MAKFEKREVRTYKVYAICPECGAQLVSTGELLFTCPLKLKYQCCNSECNYEEALDNTYPSLEYEEVLV